MKLIFILLVIYLCYVIIKGFVAKGGLSRNRGHDLHQDGPSHGGRTGGEAQEGEEMVQDPVCLSYVPISSVVTLQAAQGEVYFCSDECRDKYRDNSVDV